MATLAFSQKSLLIPSRPPLSLAYTCKNNRPSQRAYVAPFAPTPHGRRIALGTSLQDLTSYMMFTASIAAPLTGAARAVLAHMRAIGWREAEEAGHRDKGDGGDAEKSDVKISHTG